MTRVRFIVCSSLLASLAIAADRPPRYSARLADGRRIESDRLGNWHDDVGIPHLGREPLLNPSNPCIWLRDRTQRLPELPAAYVELTNGDRLPGTVVDYRAGEEDRYHAQPPHLIVRTPLTFEPPENKPIKEVRVLAQYVRRIVWQRRGSELAPPGTARYRDGRSLAVRAARFHPGEVHVLMADGDRRVDWGELAELHLPAVDPWTAWFDQLAAISPTATATRIIECETSSGLVATASLARMAARFEGNSADSDRWVHGLQPAWSLDILWVPFREIACYRTFAPHEIPLSRAAFQAANSRGALGGGPAAQVNRSVVSTPLRSKSLDFGWGLGVSGGTELTFVLPPASRFVRTAVCLDRAAGSGGCIRPRIFDGDGNRRLLWEGPLIIGSETIVDSGRIALGLASTEARTLVLQIDPVATGKPRGADPLDIRDYADWCDGVIEMDSAAVRGELVARVSQHFAAWRNWTMHGASGNVAAGEFDVTFHRNDEIPGAFEPAVRAVRSPLVLRRDLAIGPSDNWLVIAAVHPKSSHEKPRLEVLIGGRPAAAFAVPDGQEKREESQPLAVSLASYQQSSGAFIPVEIRQLPGPQGSAAQYRSITTAEQLPTLHRLLEDEAAAVAIRADRPGEALMVADDRYFGARSLRVTPSGLFRIDLPNVARIRAQPKWNEFRFLRFAIRKKGGGRAAIELEAGDKRDTPARYDLGRGEPSYGLALRISPEPLIDAWTVITCDLFADFGNLDVESIAVGCPDGEAALFDHVYLARTRVDLELIRPLPTDEAVVSGSGGVDLPHR